MAVAVLKILVFASALSVNSFPEGAEGIPSTGMKSAGLSAGHLFILGRGT